MDGCGGCYGKCIRPALGASGGGVLSGKRSEFSSVPRYRTRFPYRKTLVVLPRGKDRTWDIECSLREDVFGLWIKLLHKRGIYMSIFSEQLKEFISQKQMTVYSLAQKCDMDRSNVYKMVQGRRKPSGQGQVEHMAEALALTPYERGKLLEAYHITSLGEDLYYERKAIIRFIESLRQDESGETIVPQIKRGSFPAGEDRALQGENNVNSCLLCMVEREMEKEKPEIRMICQPEYDFLYKLLSIYGRGKKSAEISHIMCMEEERETGREQYNISCLTGISPLLMSSGEYRVYSYYDRIQAHFYNMNLFPYLVLTSESAVLLTSDVSSGLYFSDKEKKEMFLPGSTPAKAVSAPLCVKRVTSPISAIS